ncbi:hypothetical protein ACHAPU_003559 [Fusarium lateritium]
MTQAEFLSILGSEWELGKGRVDWFSFAGGKISTDPSKPSRPGRAYVHVMRKDDILALSETVRNAVWEDAKASFNSPSLIGPPSVEFAIYKKIPSNKKRTDARQGTIDQDPEFMAFLEELANPAPPNQTLEGEEGDELGKAETKVTTTPLIEYLKEKKASKTKDGASSKNSKHGDSRGGKGKNSSKDDDSGKKKGRESKAERAEKAPRETVKILTKKAAAEQSAEASKANAKSQTNDSSSQEAAPKSRRAGILAAARILQRDLGLSPGSAHRKARQDAAKADTDSKTTPEKETTTASDAKTSTAEPPASPVKSTEAEAPTTRGRGAAANSNKQQPANRRTRGGKNTEKGKEKEKEGSKESKEKDKTREGTSSQSQAAPNPPIVLLKKKGNEAESSQQAKPANTTPQPAATQGGRSKADSAAGSSKGGSSKAANAQKKPSTVSPGATRGFVKHANPSQGVTEALLKQTLSTFGTITFVEIDKRKGFAYVDFTEHEGLVKAVTASPITVAQGTVQVLERKDKKPANAGSTVPTTAPAPAPAAGSAAQEKTSGRGRRGRGGGGGGGNKAKDSGANNQSAAATQSTSANSGG